MSACWRFAPHRCRASRRPSADGYGALRGGPAQPVRAQQTNRRFAAPASRARLDGPSRPLRKGIAAASHHATGQGEGSGRPVADKAHRPEERAPDFPVVHLRHVDFPFQRCPLPWFQSAKRNARQGLQGRIPPDRAPDPEKHARPKPAARCGSFNRRPVRGHRNAAAVPGAFKAHGRRPRSSQGRGGGLASGYWTLPSVWPDSLTLAQPLPPMNRK